MVDSSGYLGIPACQIHYSVFRTELSRISGTLTDSQCPMGILRLVDHPRYNYAQITFSHAKTYGCTGVWKLIRPLMDPVVAAKVQFTRNIDDLSKFISPENILTDLGGSDDWTYKYIEPDPSENDLQNDTETKNAVMAERMSLGLNFILQTSAWIAETDLKGESADEATVRKSEERRAESVTQLQKCYWKIDPYIRARCQMDREGVVVPDS